MPDIGYYLHICMLLLAIRQNIGAFAANSLTGQSKILGPLMLQSTQRLRSPWHRAVHSFLFHFLHTPSKPSSIKRFL